MTPIPPPVPPLSFSTPPADPPSRLRETIAWIVILVSATVVIVLTWYRYHQQAVSAVSSSAPSATRVTQLTIVAKFAVGARQMLEAAGAGAGNTTAASQLQQATAQLEQQAVAPTEKLRLAMTLGDLQDAKAALSRIDAVEPTITTDPVRQDIETLRAIYTAGPQTLSPEQRQRLVDRYGWFGHLALGLGQKPANEDRAIAMAAARRTMVTLIVATIVGLVALLAGFVLLIVAAVYFANGQVRTAFVPALPRAPFLEAFAWYLGGYLVISLIGRYVLPSLFQHLAAYYVVLLLPPALGILWPLWCGVPRENWRRGLGWHTGRGAIREILLGWVGYLAGFPVLAVAFWITSRLTRFAGAQPDHPVLHELTGSRAQLTEVFVLACIYAPIIEETMFRGALFNSLRTRWGWLLSAAVTSLLFAAIHPQGWTLIPMLGSIAMVLAAIREWRGTIFASAAAHALNNGAVLALAVSVLR